MERAIIESFVASIPISELGKVPEDNEIWEEVDGGAKFMVTRHVLPTPDRNEIISLSISGKPNEVERVIGEFCEALGKPYTDAQTTPLTSDDLVFMAWLV